MGQVVKVAGTPAFGILKTVATIPGLRRLEPRLPDALFIIAGVPFDLDKQVQRASGPLGDIDTRPE